MSTPLLSIGIIFKNEIRCLERCLESLQPLRDAIPCELVMADTGSDDGSRAVAERYADILFDFPWVNDFSAARNAAMDRCSGKWYMTIDCDEWVDPNIEGYVTFLTTNRDFDFGSVIIRNYETLDLENGGKYSDFLAVRFLRLSTGLRYEGSVHEHWPYSGDLKTMLIRNAVFHHDGYIFQDPAKKKEKQERNMALLQKQLDMDPDNLVILNQCIESAIHAPEQEGYLRRAIAGVEEKRSQWALFGPTIYRHAVRFALANRLPETDEWIEKAEAMFPDSVFVRVEIAYYAFGYAWNKDDDEKSIYWGEKYLQGVKDYVSGRFNRSDILASALSKADSYSYLSVATVLASGYLRKKQPEKCLQLLESLDFKELDKKQAGDCVRNLCNLYSHFQVNTAPLLLRLWDEINEPHPSQDKADQRRSGFLQVGGEMFEGAFVRAEESEAGALRHACDAFLPLAGRCVLGDAAEMLETEESATLETLLCGVEKLEELPPYVLSHALRQGVRFPLPDYPLALEKMDIVIAGIAREKGELFALARQFAEKDIPENAQEVAWARGLCMAALKVCGWKEIDGETGLLLARAFARVEKAYLPLCYAAGALGENLLLLPPLHRFGYYCAQAFDVLDMGNGTGYIHLLREGLAVCEGARDMVEFLLDNTPALKSTSDELSALAEQIRGILAKFSPDDPAVTALKSSETYQKVAYLIEGMEAPIVGGQMQ